MRGEADFGGEVNDHNGSDTYYNTRGQHESKSGCLKEGTFQLGDAPNGLIDTRNAGLILREIFLALGGNY